MIDTVNIQSYDALGHRIVYAIWLFILGVCYKDNSYTAEHTSLSTSHSVTEEIKISMQSITIYNG